MSGIAPQSAEDGYEPKPTLRNATTIGFQAGVVGAFVSAVQNALGSHSRGAAGFLTRSGGTIGTFGKKNNLACNMRELNQASPLKLPWAPLLLSRSQLSQTNEKQMMH